ncbi:MAG: prepilin-type N-terminal cleavage/methylation domain-containing protein [Rhodanobacteraceae bacterium]|nr:MAG: prepilin-type N-terminal cleavage/methylation domain-containing protein [Rhodanobacteraceae bacterium]
MKSMQKGFTLIELMIVVAIIAILAAIAIPAYQNYLIRSQVSEGASLMGGAKTASLEFYSNHGYWPNANSSAGLATDTSITGKYVSKVDVANTGIITATFSDTGPQAANKVLNGEVLSFSPVSNGGGTFAWSCTNAATTINQKYLPSSCRK